MTTPKYGRPAPDSPGTPDRWLVLTLAALDYFILYAHRSLIAYVKRPLLGELGLNEEQFGWLGAAFDLPYCLAQIGVSYLGDRFARRTVLLGSLSVSVASMAAMGLARDFAELVVWRVLLGLAQSASVPAMAGALADSFTPRTRSTAVSIFLVSYNLALVLAATLCGRIADTPVWVLPLGPWGGRNLEVSGWRMAVFAFTALGGLGLLLFWALFREPPRTRSEQSREEAGAPVALGPALIAVLRVRSYRAITVAYVLSVTALTAVQLWLPGYLAQRFQLTLEAAAFRATFAMQAATVAGLLVGGPWADRLARRRMTGRTWVQVVGLLASAPALLALGTGGHLNGLTLPLVVYGFGTGLYSANLWTTTFEVVPPSVRSTAIGLLNVTSGVLGFGCNPLIGRYAEQGGTLGTALSALGLPVAASVAVLLYSGKFLLPKDYRGPLRPANDA
jgi:MFS family permease